MSKFYIYFNIKINKKKNKYIKNKNKIVITLVIKFNNITINIHMKDHFFCLVFFKSW